MSLKKRKIQKNKGDVFSQVQCECTLDKENKAVLGRAEIKKSEGSGCDNKLTRLNIGNGYSSLCKGKKRGSSQRVQDNKIEKFQRP